MAKNKEKYDHAGQPTKYKPEYCQGIIDFFDVEPWETEEIEHFKDGEVTWIDKKRVQRRMPSLYKFSKSIKVAYRTVYNWVDSQHDSFQAEFLQALNTAKLIRKEWLIDVGLSGSAPSNSFKFVAVNCTDMRDKQEQKHGITEELSNLLGLIDGSSKGKLPTKQEAENTG